MSTTVKAHAVPADRQTEPRGWQQWLPVAVVGTFTVVAFVLRFAGLHASLTGDELFAYDDVHGRSLASMLNYIGHNEESSPPLFFIFAWLTAHVGDPTETIRLPSIVLGAATVPLMYLLGRRTVGVAAGVVAAGLFALDPFAIWQGAEGRPYGALMFFCVASSLLLLVALDSRRPWSWWWAAYAVSVAAVVYTHYTGVFVLAAQTLWALWARRDRWAQIAAATVGAVILYIPWLPFYHGSDLGAYNVLGVPLVPRQIGQTLLQALIGHPAFTSLGALPGTAPTIVFVSVFAIIGAAVAGTAFRSRGTPLTGHPRIVLIILLSAAAPVGVLLYASVSYDILLVRNLVSSEPFALITVAWLAVVAWPRARAVAAIGVATALSVMAIGAVKTLGPGAQRANYRQVFAFINARSRPFDPIIDQSVFPLALGYIRYVPAYVSHPYQTPPLGSPQAAAAWARASAGGRVFLIAEAIGLERNYRPTPFDGANPSCATTPRGSMPPPGCAALRVTHRYTALQPVVVSMYSGR